MERELIEALRAFPQAIFEGVSLSVGKGMLVFYVVSLLMVGARLVGRKRR